MVKKPIRFIAPICLKKPLKHFESMWYRLKDLSPHLWVMGGIRSFECCATSRIRFVRPVRWFKGVPSPMKHPELTDMVDFRENSEDIYAGTECKAGSTDAKK